MVDDSTHRRASRSGQVIEEEISNFGGHDGIQIDRHVISPMQSFLVVPGGGGKKKRSKQSNKGKTKTTVKKL